MEFITSLLDSLSAEPIYAAGFGYAQWFAGAVSGTLLLFAVMIRSAQLNIEQLHGKPNYGQFITQAFMYSAALALYAALMNFVADGFNALYAVSDSFGGLPAIQENMNELVEKITKGENPDDEGPSLLSNPGAWVPYLIYFFSLVLATAATVLLRIAQAIAICLAYWWGLVALPVSLVSGFKLLKGWGVLLAVALLWPVIEAFFIFLFGYTFANSVEILTSYSDSYFAKQVILAQAYFLFAVLNLIIFAIVIAAPFITQSLVTNAGSIGGLVTPFIGAAITTAAAATKFTHAGAQQAAKLGGGALKSDAAKAAYGAVGAAFGSSMAGDYAGTKLQDIAQRRKASKANSPFTKFMEKTTAADTIDGSNATKAAKGYSFQNSNHSSPAKKAAVGSQVFKNNFSDSGGAASSESSAPEPSESNSEKRKKQQRRGAIINQQHNKKK